MDATNTGNSWSTSDYIAASGALLNAGAQVYAANMGKASRKAYINLTREMAQYNNEMAEKHWKMQNEYNESYNSPAAQMARYKEAGLNPNLIYGQSNTASAPLNTPTADTPNIDSPVGINPFQAAASAVDAYQNIKGRQIANTNAAIVGNLNSVRTANEEKKGIALDLANQITQRTADYKVEMQAAKLASEKFMVNYKQTVWLQQELNKVDLQLEQLQNSRVSRRKNQEEITNLQYSRRLIQSQIENLNQETAAIQETMPYKIEEMKSSAANQYANAAATRFETKEKKRFWKNNVVMPDGNKVPLPLYMQYQRVWGTDAQRSHTKAATEMLNWQMSEQPVWHKLIGALGTAAIGYGFAKGAGMIGKGKAAAGAAKSTRVGGNSWTGTVFYE